MVVKHATCNIQASIKLGDRNMPCNWPAESLPEVPVMTNVGKLAKHTRLIVKEDQDIIALMEQQHKEAMKEEDAANKENESSNEATAVGHKKAPKRKLLTSGKKDVPVKKHTRKR